MMKRTRNLLLIPSYPLFMACMMLQGMAVSISLPFMPIYFTTKLGISVGSFGIFTAVTLVSGIWLSSLIAKCSDTRLDRKKIMVTAMLFNALAFAGYLFIHEFYLLLLFMTIFTAIGAPAMPQLFASAREAVDASHSADHAFANSMLRSMFSLGFITGPLIGSILIHYLNFKGIFICSSLIFLINTMLIFCFIHRPLSPAKVGSKKLHVTIKLHRNPGVLLPFMVLTLLYTGHWINSLNISLFIINTLGGSTRNVALVSSICALLEIPIMFVLGLLSTKYSNRLLMVWGTLLDGAYYVLVLTSTGIWQILAGQVLLAFFVAVISAIGISYIQDLLPDMPGYASTLFSNASTIGKLVGSLAGGAIAQWVGYRGSYWGCLILIALSLGILAYPQRYPIKNEKR